MKITLCGSTKFRDQFVDWNRRLSKMGHIVYSVSCFGHSGDTLPPAEKEIVDLVHLRKIVESDAIFIVGSQPHPTVPNGFPQLYIGESTRREIRWAKLWDKTIYAVAPFLETGWGEYNPDNMLAEFD